MLPTANQCHLARTCDCKSRGVRTQCRVPPRPSIGVLSAFAPFSVHGRFPLLLHRLLDFRPAQLLFRPKLPEYKLPCAHPRTSVQARHVVEPAQAWLQPGINSALKVPADKCPIHQSVLRTRRLRSDTLRKMGITGELERIMRVGISPVNGSSLGFLTVVKDAQHGLFGGYLLLNCAGRPLEFHCTAPVKPNRAQQILYGATLEEFLFGEHIGQTLLAQSQLQPLVVCTDCPPALSVRQFSKAPVVLVLDEQSSAETTAAGGCDALRADGQRRTVELARFEVGRNRLAVPRAADEDRRLIEERLQRWADSLDLLEPFERIRQAIEEAKQAVCQQS